MISPQKKQLSLENEIFEIYRNSAYIKYNDFKLDGTTSFVGEDDFILIGGTKNRSCNGEHISLRADKKSLNVINIDRLTKRSGKSGSLLVAL